MCNSALRRLEYGDTTEERAQTEELEFDVPMGGVVVVTNVDHDSAHTVNIAAGMPVSCSCKADTYHDGACKHRIACAMHESVIEAAMVGDQERPIPDGGEVVLDAETPDETSETGCPHDHPDCEVGTGKERPVMCWDCFEVSRQ